MDQAYISNELADIIPRSTKEYGLPSPDVQEAIKKESASIEARKSAKELAAIKSREMARLKKLKANENKEIDAMLEEQQRIDTINKIENSSAQPLNISKITPATGLSKSELNDVLAMQGTTRPEVLKLLASLNINLSVQLTKQDTSNLLACLLTCNNTQLNALLRNDKVPIVIKTVIKRLLEDEKFGNIETIERLWDRIFGKGPLQMDLPAQAQLETGILPNTPISREAYIIIRDTLIK